MGALEAAEDHGAEAQVWLARAIHAPADACWVAEGYQSHIWVAVVPETGAFDALNWQMPPQREGARAALVPPSPRTPEPPSSDPLPAQALVPAEGEEDTATAEPDADSQVDETAGHDTLPEHVVIAPDDPGPEGSGIDDNGAKGESAKW